MNSWHRPIRQLSVSLFLLLSATISIHGQQRVWNDNTGDFSVDAELVKSDQKSVTLKRSDNGKIIKVPISRLSTADRRYLAREKAASPGNKLNVKGKIVWSEVQYGREKPDRDLQLEIIVRGKDAAQALSYGQLDLRSALDDAGNEIEIKKSRFMSRNITDEFRKIDRSDQFFAKHPKDGVRAVVALQTDDAPPRQISKILGTFKLRTGGELSKMKIENAAQKNGDNLESQQLAALGIEGKVKNLNQMLSLDLTGNHQLIQKVEVRKPSGGKYSEQNGSGEGGGGNMHQYQFFFDNKVPGDAVLVVHIAKNPRELVVPFEFDNLKVPKKPANDSF